MNTTHPSHSCQRLPTIPVIQNAGFSAPLHSSTNRGLDTVTDLLAHSPFLIGRRGLGMNLFPSHETRHA